MCGFVWLAGMGLRPREGVLKRPAQVVSKALKRTMVVRLMNHAVSVADM